MAANLRSVRERVETKSRRLVTGERNTTSDHDHLEVRILGSITEVNANQWDNLVTQSDLGSVFHSYGWLRAIEEGLGLEPRHVLVSKNGNPVALFPNVVSDLEVPIDSPLVDRLGLRQLVSTTPGYGGPVIGGDESTCFDLLLDGAERAADGTVQHAIRWNGPEYLRYGKHLLGRGYHPEVVTGRFVVDLYDDWETIKGRMSKTRRKAIRQALDGEYEIHEGSIFDLEGFYEDYVGNIERVGGEPYPRAFFEALDRYLGDNVVVFSVVVDDVVVGRYLYLLDEVQSTVHYYFSAIGSDDDYEHAPSERLHVHALQWAIDNGYAHYDFGSTSANFEDTRFRQKERFGGRFVPTIEWERGRAPVRWGAYRLARTLYRRLTYPVTAT